jgi:hypothetical protein
MMIWQGIVNAFGVQSQQISGKWLSLSNLTQEEKELMLWKNLERLLGL